MPKNDEEGLQETLKCFDYLAMKHYNYQQRLHELWRKAVDTYERGQRGAETFFSPEDAAWLLANGITAQEIYDFAEDYVSGGEPDFPTFAMITDVRRRYFLHELKGQHSEQKKDPATYPAKDSEAEGIVWLPRIIEKAKAKLRGQLDNDTMYSCGGDRRFFKENDIHAAEFLRVVEMHMDDDAAIIAWVKARRAESL